MIFEQILYYTVILAIDTFLTIFFIILNKITGTGPMSIITINLNPASFQPPSIVNKIIDPKTPINCKSQHTFTACMR